MTEKSINRLILLGNGFDLAHQIKTSYNDFIKWYLIQAMEMAKFHRQYVDEPMTITYPEYDAMDYLSKHGLNTIPEFVDYFYKKRIFWDDKCVFHQNWPLHFGTKWPKNELPNKSQEFLSPEPI